MHCKRPVSIFVDIRHHCQLSDRACLLHSEQPGCRNHSSLNFYFIFLKKTWECGKCRRNWCGGQVLSTYINMKRFTAVESKGRKSGIMGYGGNVGYRMEWPKGRKKIKSGMKRWGGMLRVWPGGRGDSWVVTPDVSTPSTPSQCSTDPAIIISSNKSDPHPGRGRRIRKGQKIS